VNYGSIIDVNLKHKLLSRAVDKNNDNTREDKTREIEDDNDDNLRTTTSTNNKKQQTQQHE